MQDNLNYEDFCSIFFDENNSFKTETKRQFSQEPCLLDINLYLILAELCRTVEGRSLAKKRFHFSDSSIAVLRQINRGNVRNFAGIINVSFQSAIPHQEIVREFRNGAFLDFSPPTGNSTKEEQLFQQFCGEFWLAVMRQVAQNAPIARLVFGLSKPVVEVLQDANCMQILAFARSPIQSFDLRLGAKFFEAILSIPNAAENPNVDLVKIGYAAQSLACFADLPSLLSSTDSLEFSEQIPQVDEAEDTLQQLPSQHLSSLCHRSSISSIYEQQKAKLTKKSIKPDLRMKQMMGMLLMNRGLSMTQASYTCGYETWQARQDSKHLPSTIDSRTRKKVRMTPELRVQRLIFFCIYATLAGEDGLVNPDLDAFFRTESLMQKTTIKSRIGKVQMSVADRYNEVKLLTQGLIYLQHCPSCNFVSFHQRKHGNFLKKESEILPCSFCSLFSTEPSLGMFSRYIKNTHETAPETQ